MPTPNRTIKNLRLQLARAIAADQTKDEKIARLNARVVELEEHNETQNANWELTCRDLAAEKAGRAADREAHDKALAEAREAHKKQVAELNGLIAKWLSRHDETDLGQLVANSRAHVRGIGRGWVTTKWVMTDEGAAPNAEVSK